MYHLMLASWLDGVPVAPTAGGVLALVIVISYRLITDRSAVMSEVQALSRQVNTLETKVQNLEELNEEERGLKHKAWNDVARTKMALELVRNLSLKCTCRVLAPLNEIIGGVFDDLETVQFQRQSELDRRN